MKSVLVSKPSLFSLNNIRLKKKSVQLKKIIKYILKLKTTLNEKKEFKRLSFLNYNNSLKDNFARKKKGLVVLYTICFSFSSVNTFLYVTDSRGNLKFRYSAGLLDFKGKAKRSRFQILKMFFKKLRILKLNLLKDKPISVVLKNVGSYRHRIVRELKKKFFIRIVNNFQSHSYNGWLSGLKRQIVNLLNFFIVGSNPALFIT
uniref:Ribosomal protein S11 n=1 Tax=Navicula ramosissima TaxID=265559 RepID=A0A343A6V7_9STRA|nr:ribosomal protein S11 [Navicula ramosissima]AOY40395.1 ribosomal protein S11 [Navicula ramosissima]